MSESHQKYLIWRRMKAKFRIDLKDKHLDLIEDVYYESRKENVKNVGIYRFINVIFSIFSFLIWLLVSGTKFEKWTFLIIIFVFLLINLVQLFRQYVFYRRLKDKNFFRKNEQH